MNKRKLLFALRSVLLGIGAGIVGLAVDEFFTRLSDRRQSNPDVPWFYLCVVIVVCTCYLADILNKMWRGEPPEEDTEDKQE